MSPPLSDRIITRATNLLTETIDDRIARRMTAPDFPTWHAKTAATGGCLRPIRLSGHSRITHTTTGKILSDTLEEILTPCGTRRATLCPACSDTYAADAYHLVRAGIAGGKTVPTTVTGHPMIFATLTAPSFGPVHGPRSTSAGRLLPCRCGRHHHPTDPLNGTPLRPDRYDYTHHVLWNAHTGQLWHRFTIAVGRALARHAGIHVRDLRTVARLSYTKVAEYQRRGVIHFHAVIRLDGPDGPATPPPPWATPDMLTAAITTAAQTVTVTTARPDGQTLALGWGTQIDTRPITADTPAGTAPDDGFTADQLAAYIAKYATKTVTDTDNTPGAAGTDHRIRSDRHIDYLTGITDHHRTLIRTAWTLGGDPAYAKLNLRRWAHMLGFRGHFLTKSRAYSVTFGTIRDERAQHARTAALARLGITDPDTITVINHWRFTSAGHHDDAERELAHAIATRRRDQRREHARTQQTERTAA